MPIINITVRGKKAMNLAEDEYICGNSDYLIAFNFDSEWDVLSTKTARFVKENGEWIDQIFTGSKCPMPTITDTYRIFVGVFAGNLRTTTPACVLAKKSILCGNGFPANPSPDVYTQIMAMYADIENAATETMQEAVAQGTACIQQAAKDAVTGANAAAEAATKAAGNADEKANLAAEKARLADTATESAKAAATIAQEKATLADEKAAIASDAAVEANHQAQAAQWAAEAANEAAEAANQAAQDAQPIDDTAITAWNPWSSKRTVGSLCQPFSATGNPVQVYPVEDYPLNVTVAIEPVQAEGTPSPDNPLPITVPTGSTTVWHNSANLLPYPYKQGSSYTANGVTFTVQDDGGVFCSGTATGSTYFILYGGFDGAAVYRLDNLVEGQTYTISGGRVNADAAIFFYGTPDGTVSARRSTFVVPQHRTIGIFINVAPNITVNETIYPQINAGSTALPYEPYIGASYMVDLPDGFSGGTVDVTGGAATDEWVVREFDGTEDWRATDNLYCVLWKQTAALDYGGNTQKHSHGTTRREYGVYGNMFAQPNNAIVAAGAYMHHGSVEAWKEYLAAQKANGTPVTLAYKVATPTTHAITPQPIAAIDGVNTIMTDAVSLTVTGAEDPKHTIGTLEKRLAALEAVAVSE